MKYVYLTLNWVFGVFFGLMGAVSLIESPAGGLCLIAISLLLLPPVRNAVYSKTNKELPVKARAISIFVLFIAFGTFVAQSQDKKASERAAQKSQSQAEQAAKVRQASVSGDDNTSKKQSVASQSPSPAKRNVPAECDASTAITGKKYNVLGSGINVRKGPGTSYEKIINQKATSILKTTQYITIDDTTTVFEECTKDGWSWIRVVDPDWLQDSHRGWAASKFLDKGQDIGGDKYARKISSSALSPYTKQGYPKTIAKYGSRLSKIESLRRKAAEKAVDSGKCDYVLMSELSDSKSSLNHLHFWVDCRNKQRIYLDEFEIKKGSQILTQEEKSWDKESALRACQHAIKASALIPSEVDIHTILGTSLYKAPTTHNVVLHMDFDAKNALGTEIPYTATCHFKPGEVGTIDIQPRQ